MQSPALWFAFILLSLSYWKQRYPHSLFLLFCCDLLSFYYLCRTGNNHLNSNHYEQHVVICFHFTIFVVLETTLEWKNNNIFLLWFAFILLSLSYWKQLFLICRSKFSCCDLLSFYYLCRTGNNTWHWGCQSDFVVICFHFTIFVVLETTDVVYLVIVVPLWFAFILLSLSYWKQLRTYGTIPVMRCDLLSFYYLCRTGNNSLSVSDINVCVVICFHFTIFVVLETTI